MTSSVASTFTQQFDKANPLSSGGKKDAGEALSQNYETFLKLLTTQLQYQDPLQPQDSSEFTKQLVSFSQVEQQISTNKKLDSLIGAYNGGQAMQALNYIGNVVEYVGEDLALINGRTDIGVTLDSGAISAQLVIEDTTGRELSRQDLAIQTGTQMVSWNGRNASGEQMPDGAYRVRVEAVTRDGEPVAAVTRVAGRVSGVDMSTPQPTLLIGSLPIALTAVTSVRAQ